MSSASIFAPRREQLHRDHEAGNATLTISESLE
jgi:hypothetical protein